MPIISLPQLIRQIKWRWTFKRSVLGKSLEADTLNIPNSKPPPTTEETLPFVIVGDEAFSIKRYLLPPYAGIWTRNDESKKLYNYRLSRARRVVENAFGILTQNCRLFCDRIRLRPANAEKMICVEDVTENRDAPSESKHFIVTQEMLTRKS